MEEMREHAGRADHRAVAYHGEGPVWSERWGGLRWVDMLAGDVLSLRPDGAIGGTTSAPSRRPSAACGAAR